MPFGEITTTHVSIRGRVRGDETILANLKVLGRINYCPAKDLSLPIYRLCQDGHNGYNEADRPFLSVGIYPRCCYPRCIRCCRDAPFCQIPLRSAMHESASIVHLLSDF